MMLIVCLLCMDITNAQGDQILDGIGETGLIARYLLDGDTKDWSRNNLHATVKGEKITFVNDKLFGKVITLSSETNDYITIPGTAVGNEESISLTGWINLRSIKSGQCFFDFGKSLQSHVITTLIDSNGKNEFSTEIVLESGGYKTKKTVLEAHEWSMFSVVIDVPSKSLRTFLNGKLISETKDIEIELNQLFNNASDGKNQLFIGKLLSSNKSCLDAKLHDFRIYRIPLNKSQIKTIYYNGLKKGDQVVNENERKDDDLEVFSKTTPQLYNKFLIGVSDIAVETTVGFLPKLPRYVKAVYKNGIELSQARVLWSAPKDNTKVLKVGSYTVTGLIPGTDLKSKATVVVKEAKKVFSPNKNLEVFNLDQVSLNTDSNGDNTKFIENRDKFITTLAQTNPDNFLYMFRNAFGQKQPEGAEPLGVWDSQETKLRGHATGHYLTAIAQAYASTGYDTSLQANFLYKMEYMVNVLYELSQLSGKPKQAGSPFVSEPTAVPPGVGKSDYDSDLSIEGIRTDYWNWGEGFISAYPPDQFIMLEKGAIYGTQNTKIWAPYYTLHKILAGLLDIYEVSKNPKALEIAMGMGDWVHIRLSQLPTETLISMWNRYIAGEFGGMNEVMARLYRVTNEPRYLEVAKLFDNIKMFYGDANHSHGLAKNVDTFRGLHANQHIPQIVGALEMYRDSNIPDYFYISDNFWYKTTNDYMYTIGGVAGARNPNNAECFIKEPATIYENGLSAGGQNETCATYNMLKLTKNLFLYDQRGELMDYYERALYNDILASVAKDSPANTYHIPLRAGSIKHFGNPDMKGFTCCNGTALESSTKLQNTIYFKSRDQKSLYVNLYVPSTLNWTEKNIIIEQKTAFPKEDNTQLVIKGKGKFNIRLRIPHWATKGFYVSINGKEQKVDAKPGSYLTLNRKWKKGDVVDIQMPFQFHLESVMDQQNIASLFYGPILLAAQETESRKDWRKVTLDANDISKNIKGDTSQLKFTIDGVEFKPFYETYGRYSVYLNVILK
ncbi:glycoside hydrolase family 127 protein [Wenyingzhuangia sp. chi5]|uniref:Glycoside hydrolase family 127 protein n=2 Tax=Wenyingzhuangia gilva TaxID=3057677 RepID=A0ABT8VTN2_9FLAO|nr:beta-L-arabinofuranosidase domain-containing protein [Wenyingzhuangia sp. chi5]MDO3695322.1 glycoside hydrolase family 127 protein [Wenyingzhuangia sp. chi5]